MGKYIEKNKEDSSLFLYKTLEIQRYLNRFFKLYKIKVHNCKILYSENLLQIFLSFYVTTATFYIIKKNLNKYSKECKKTFKPHFSNKYKQIKKIYPNKLNILNTKKKIKNRKLNISNFLNHNFNLNSTTNLIKFQKLLQSVLIYKKLKKKSFKCRKIKKKKKKKKKKKS